MHINDVFFSVSNKKQFEIWTYIFREILINAYIKIVFHLMHMHASPHVYECSTSCS